jgi:hypothetical protein
MRKFSLCLHDVRLSQPDATIAMIEELLHDFGAPLSVHLVLDGAITPQNRLIRFMIKNEKAGRIETVFHGTTHQTDGKARPLLAFYHKYQAEFITHNRESIRRNTTAYKAASGVLKRRPGICPSCWLSSPANKKMFASFNPPYIESLMSFSFTGKRIPSPVISLAATSFIELFFLKIAARLMYIWSLVIPGSRVRLVVHVCDFSVDTSMKFFQRYYRRLLKNSRQVTQMDLAD